MPDAEYDPEHRLAECPDEDAHEGIVGVELAFAIPVTITMAQYRRLCALMEEITSAPWNTPKEGLHWFSTQGSKLIWSKVDAALLGVPAAPDAHDSGEPRSDDSVIALESSARGFGSDRERDAVLQRRQREAAEETRVMHVFLVPQRAGRGDLQTACGLLLSDASEYDHVTLHGNEVTCAKCQEAVVRMQENARD